MSTLGGDPSKNEKQRLCPSCRMSISTLATRCHYCGEEVARPKVEDRKLTIQDLGGHGENKFRLSGSVLDALEAFRMEEGVSANATPAPGKKKGLFGRSSQPKEAATPDAGPMLQQPSNQSTALLDEMGLAPRATPTVQRRDPSWVTKIGVLGGFIAGIVILFFGGVKGFAMISDYLASRHPQPPAVANLAPELLAQNKDVIVALEAAMKALKANPNEENENIAAQVRRAVVQRIDDRLNASDWTRQDLTEASRIAHQAAAIDSNDLINRYLKMADEETEAYLITLKSTDADAKTATFVRVGQEVMVREGDPFWHRFILKKVQKDGVYVEDPYRNKRRIWYGRDGVIKLAN